MFREYLYLKGQRRALVVGGRQPGGNVYTFRGTAMDGETKAIQTADLSNRTLRLNDSEGRDST